MCKQLVDACANHGGTKRILRRKAPEHRAVPDPGAPCDLVGRDLRAELGVRVRCGPENPVEVALCVGAQSRHQAGTVAASPAAACASIRATCRLRRSASITPSAAIITIA